MTTRSDPNAGTRDQDECAASWTRARSAPLPQEYERLALLYAVGKLLTDYRGLDVTWPLLLAALNAVMGLRTAVLITSFRGSERVFTWRGSLASLEDLERAEGHARKVLTFLDRGDRDLAGALERPFITLPLLHGGRRVLGVLQLEGARPLEERDVLLLNAVASELAAVVIGQHAWRVAGASVVDLQDSHRWLRKLQDLSSAALESATLDEALPAVLRALCRLFGTEVAELVLLSDDTKRARQVYKRASLGLPDAALTHGVGELGMAIRVAAAGSPVLFDDPGVLEQVGLSPLNAQLGSVIGAPLCISGRIVGVVWTATGKQPGFTRTELAVLSAVAEGLAPVIEHTRLLDEQRKLTQALAAQNDALRTTQLALQATRDDYGTLYDLAPVGYVTLDATSAIEKLNRMAARLLGMDQADAVGTLFSDQVAQVDRPRFIEHVRHCLEDAQPRTIELTLVGRNQQNPCVRLDSMALVSASSSAQSVCFTALVDISESRRAQLERERMEARLQEVQRLESLGVLAGGIAHDFNNLLSIILGHATLGVGSIHNPEVTHASFVQIEAASLRAADLCKQMLSYSSRTRCQRRPLALNQLLEDTTRLLRTSIQQGIRFHTELAPDLPAILGDSSELIQLTMNLVINAAESMESGSGTVLVRTEVVHGARDRLEKLRLGTNLTEGEFVVLTVEDTGVGMNAATLDKMFEPFFTTKFLGRGLGLAVAFGVLRRHEAGLEVNSREGSGTSFRVWFPLCSQPVVQVPVAPTPHPGRRLHGRALLVDDDDAVRETTALMLQDLGFEVHQAHDGTEAIALYAQDPEAFAAVLLDLSMPGLGGREVFEALKAIRHAVRVLLISGFSEEQMTSAFPPDVAPAAFLQKPLRREALHAELEKMLEVEPSSEPNDASPVTVSPNGRAS